MSSNRGFAVPQSVLLIVISFSLIACGRMNETFQVTADGGAQAAQCADSKAVLVPETGSYSRTIKTDFPQAQAFFDQGLRLTYSYYFPEAIASFDAALCFDPGNPMIEWGRALAIAPNPNSRYGGAPDDRSEAGKEAIARARAAMGGLPAVDQALIETLAVVFDSEGYPQQTQRSQAFIEATQALIDEYPNDLEAAFLAADAIMMATPWQYFSVEDGSPLGGAEKALAILEKGIAQNPHHPGLNHLHIHLLENSREPGRAEASADRLEALTPQAGHMVHMPGHIYMRLGRYEDAIATNERSLAADEYLKKQWGDRPLQFEVVYGISARTHSPHARNFIHWAKLLQGNSKEAIDLAREAQGVEDDLLNDGIMLRVPASYLMTLAAFGRWDEILVQPLPPESQPYLRGLLHALRGSAYMASGDIAAAEQELAELTKLAQDTRLVTQRASTNRASDLLSIAESLLRGRVAAGAGQHESAIQHFRAAVDKEDKLRYMEPPDWLHSTRLYLGQAYLDRGEYEKAEAVFRADLQRLHNNGWALYGLARSLEAQGDLEEAQAVQSQFEQAWSEADVSLRAAHF